MIIKRFYHGTHIDKIEIIPELSCEFEYHTAEEVDKADKEMLTMAPILYNYLTSL